MSPAVPRSVPPALGATIMVYCLGSDFLFWAGMALAEDQMIATLLATEPALFHDARAGEQARVRAVLHGVLPVSARRQTCHLSDRRAGLGRPRWQRCADLWQTVADFLKSV